jgi:adenosine deaminase CECR1
MPPGLQDDEWAEISEGLPAIEEPFLQKYIQGREGLIAQEKKQRSGKSLKGHMVDDS